MDCDNELYLAMHALGTYAANRGRESLRRKAAGCQECSAWSIRHDYDVIILGFARK